MDSVDRTRCERDTHAKRPRLRSRNYRSDVNPMADDLHRPPRGAIPNS
jgi:hypothetical protein